MAKLTIGVAGFLCCILSVGCTSRSSPGGEGARQLTPAEARGRDVYDQYCASCHREGKNGPRLEGVLKKKKYLPSGTPANDDRMRDVIRLGRATMPGFGNALNAQQIDDLIAYMHTM